MATPEELEFQRAHEEEEFAKAHAEETAGQPSPTTPAASEPVSNVTNAMVGTTAALGPKALTYGAKNLIVEPFKRAAGVNAPIEKPSGIMPTQRTFATPSEIEARTIKAGQPPRPEGPGDVVNWAMGKTPESGQYKRGYLGGTSQEHEAQLHRQADELERKNPGYKIKPGTSNFLIPESEYSNIKSVEAQAQKELENKARMNADLRQRRLSQTQVGPTLGAQIGEGALNFGKTPATKRFMTGYNISDMLQSQNPLEAGVSATGAAAPYVAPAIANMLPRKYQAIARAAGPIIGAGAPVVNYLERKMFPEGHAAGGSIQGYAGGKLVGDIVKNVTGFLEHTPKNPNPLVGTRFQLKDLGGIAPEKPISLEDIRGANINITPWDATHRNQQILSVSGRPLTSNIITHGGVPYARDIEHMEQGVVGASGPAIAGRLQTRANIASQEGEKTGGTGQVVMLPSSMGKYSEDFAVPTFQTYWDLHKQAERSPEDLSIMTEWLRSQKKQGKPIMSNLLDLSHPDAYNQLLTGEGLNASGGDARKAFIRLQRLKDNQRALGVNAEDISAAHTIPEIANLERGFAGNTAIQMQPGAKVQPSKNESYSTDFLGNYLGNLGQNTPAHVLLNKPYTNVFNEMKARYPNDPEGKIHQMAIGALERRNAGVSEVVNDELINRVGAYHEAVKQGKVDPNDPYGTLQFLKTPGAYAEGGEVEGYAGGKSVSQIPKVAQALEDYLKGNISNAERIGVMRSHLPIRKWDELPPNYTDEQIRNALMSNKQPKALADVPAGMQVGNRLDIPAYTQHGVYVDTVHDASGKPISYNRTGHLTDVDFSSKPNQAVRVGLGTKEQALTPMGAEIGSGKSPFALMKGTNVGTHDDEVRRMMEEYLKDPNWTQIGMDPRAHSQFFDKSTGLPVFHAEQKLQSGPLVMVPKQGLETSHWEDPRLQLSDFEGKHYAGGGLAELAKKILPLAEREANKAKFLENSVVKTPMYHGTRYDFSEFDPGHRGVFVSPNKKFADSFTIDAGGSSKGGNIMPVHVNVTNPFDYENPQHIEELKNRLTESIGPSYAKNYGKRVGEGSWSYIEHPQIQNTIKDMGHDSYYVSEGGVKNLGVYDPRQIKSATGNQGTYDPTVPDITKAEGGLMHLAGGGEAWQRSEGKNPEGGLNAKGRASYNKAHGAHLKAPQPEGGSRKDSFCARMEGAKKKLTSAETANDPDSRINKALRKWKC